MAMEHDVSMEANYGAEDTIMDQYLTFVIEDEEYGVEIAVVKEIIKMVPITRVPEMPEFIEGIVNLRGELIGTLDVRKRFGIMPKEHDEETCIIVIIGDRLSPGLGLLGLIVDAVRETAIIPDSQMAPPPSAKLNYANQFIRNIGRVDNDVKLLLDLEKFLALE
ncbi:MAG: chemotaxis protein CheW [Defluviitaleaceae bacterium]|nr:chemotaxis protein CheW [Defluviitaleaceae bacterium]MCL2238593.1 chemotaxis protein CheW [Defluviitaleaceae bacterium]